MPQNLFEGQEEILKKLDQQGEDITQIKSLMKSNNTRENHEEVPKKTDRQSEDIKRIQNRPQSNNMQAAVKERNDSFALKNFIARSFKEYMWLGPPKEFYKEKNVTLILVIAAIFNMIACTIAVTVIQGSYGPLTLFEHIWLLNMLFILKYTVKTKKTQEMYDLALNTVNYVEDDADGLCRQGFVKKGYRRWLTLACISSLLNALFMAAFEQPAFWCILELVNTTVNIAAFIAVSKLFSGYIPIKFTALNDAETQYVSLVFEPIENVLYTEEDYKKRHPYMY